MYLYKKTVINRWNCIGFFLNRVLIKFQKLITTLVTVAKRLSTSTQISIQDFHKALLGAIVKLSTGTFPSCSSKTFNSVALSTDTTFNTSQYYQMSFKTFSGLNNVERVVLID
jgi:hypothetical protein